MRRLGLTVAAALLAAPLAAQSPVPWRASYFPYLFGNPATGLMAVAHYQYGRQADYTARVPYDGLFSAEAGGSLHGSWFATARFRAPLLQNGWRFSADAGAVREATFGYFGEGPDGSNESYTPRSAYPDDFNQVQRTRVFAKAEVTRRLGPSLQVAAGIGLEHYRFASVGDGSLFASDDFGAPLSGTDGTGRLTVIHDTRDNENLPAKGALLEAGVYGGTGRFEERFIPPIGVPEGAYTSSTSGSGYLGAYFHLRGYVAPREGTVIAGRMAMRTLGDGAPLDALYTLPGWERDITVLGGAESHRSFVAGRFGGPTMVLTSLEVRHNLLDLGDYGAITLIAFGDAGRSYGANSFRWSFDGWQLGGGGGIGIRILRSAPLVLNFAGGPDGFRFSMSNGWSF